MSPLPGGVTPGPWRKGEMCGGCINIEADNPGATVARVHVYYNGVRRHAEENADLIVAAVNACKAVNPEHPERVAAGLEALVLAAYDALATMTSIDQHNPTLEGATGLVFDIGKLRDALAAVARGPR